jgi:hypothetical protein
MGVISTQGFTFRLMASGSNGFEQLDIFNDEEIKISNNVTGLFDIGLLPSDFTRQITLPGSKKNNAFFEHVYDISVDNPYLFSTNAKVAAYFDFDSVYLSSGYIQLNKVNVRANKFIDSYEVTVFGTLSSFSRDINKFFLTDLTSLAKYNHTSSYANIVQSWDTSSGLFNRDIVYPWCDYGSGWQFSPGFTFFGINQSVSPSAGLTTQDYKPAIRIKPVLDAIFTEAGYTYSSSFMNQSWIDNVYMVCNHSLKYPIYTGVDLEGYGVGKVTAISGSGITNINIPSGSTPTYFPFFNRLSDPQNSFDANGAYTLPISSSIQGVLNLEWNLSGSINAPGVYMYFQNTGSLATTYVALTVINQYYTDLYNANVAAGNTNINLTSTLQQEFISPVLEAGTYRFGVRWDAYPSTPVKITQDPGGTPKSYLEVTKVRQAADGRVLDIPSNMPFGTRGIKQIDFILGLQKKFNLIIYPDRTQLNNFIIETFNDWYYKGKVKDFNKYINLNNTIEVIPANNLAVNQLNFGDMLDLDYVSQQFTKESNREYAKTYYVDTANYFSQGSFDVKTTFASDPLLRIPGTGVSGSVGGLNPVIVAYEVYDGAQLYYNGNAYNLCASGNPIRTIYSTTGLVETSAKLYYDAYGQNLVQGYSFVTDRSSAGCKIYALNPSTGVVGSYTGQTCASSGGGCI